MKYTAVCDVWNEEKIYFYLRYNDDYTGVQKLLSNGMWQSIPGIDRSQPRQYKAVTKEAVDKVIEGLTANNSN